MPAATARPFEHDQTLVGAQRELARIERKLTGQAGTGDTAGAVLADGRAAEEAAA